MKFDHGNPLEEYKMMGAICLRVVVDNLNKRFHDLLICTASKHF